MTFGDCAKKNPVSISIVRQQLKKAEPTHQVVAAARARRNIDRERVRARDKRPRRDRIRILDVVPAPRPARHPAAVGLVRHGRRAAAPAVHAHDRAAARERERRRDLERARAGLRGREAEADRHGPDGLPDRHREGGHGRGADGVRDPRPAAHARVGRVHRLDPVCVLEACGRAVEVADLPDVRRVLCPRSRPGQAGREKGS